MLGTRLADELYFITYFCWTTTFLANICLGGDMYCRRLEDVFRVTFFCLSKRLQNVFARRFLEKSWRRRLKTRLENILKMSCGDVLENKKCLLGLWNTSQKLLLCSEKAEENFRETSRWLHKFKVSVCRKLVQDVGFFGEAKKQKVILA